MAASDKEEHKQATGSNEVQASSDKQTAKQKPETQNGPPKTDLPDNQLTGNMDFLLDIPLEI